MCKVCFSKEREGDKRKKHGISGGRKKKGEREGAPEGKERRNSMGGLVPCCNGI